MRVITGTARGKRLVSLQGEDVTRPTAERVKEGIFSAIQFDIEGRRVLDLFAGCGQLGIEALSRGAQSAIFVDNSEQAISVIRKNLENTGFIGKSKVVKSDYLSFALSAVEKFDIAFLDPPYKAGYLERAVEAVAPIMSDYGMIICEHPLEQKMPEQISDFASARSYRYGKIAVTLYKKRGRE